MFLTTGDFQGWTRGRGNKTRPGKGRGCSGQGKLSAGEWNVLVCYLIHSPASVSSWSGSAGAGHPGKAAFSWLGVGFVF